MGGGLMQLVAYGAQDIYLTGNPQITFFKVVYRRHTNFSMETIQQTLDGTTTLNATSNTNASCTISRNGDLVGRVYVVTRTNGVTDGSKLVNEVELEIGGQRVDKQTEEWMNVWNELSTDETKALPLKAMSGCVGSSSTTGVENLVQVPLQFWFCRNPGLALPLIALQYHEVKLKFKWGTGNDVGANAECEVFCEYIYLDTDERRRFAQISHEYLIEQVQHQVEGTASTSYTLNLNHPVKELVWTDASSVSTEKANLKLNGHDRFSEQHREYFQLRQPFDHHSAVPRQNLPAAAQTSLLDRQTQFGLITEENANNVVAQLSEETVAGDAANSFVFVAATNTISLREGGTPAGTNVSIGDQIAIVCTVDASTAGTIGTGGRTYFATATSNSTIAGNYQSFTVTVPTTADATPLTITANTTTGGGASGRFFVFKVSNGNSAQARTSKMTNRVNVYSFALKPEEHQPSGTCNFSRIDNALLKFSGAVTVANIYAVNYNVLRIMSGMGGLAYSN
jgi:hypothetical protein